MREKQKKEIRKNSLRKSNGITLIALVVTIVVLLILAGVSISMLTGDSGIISQAKNAKEQNEIGKEKEYINLAFTAVKGNKITNGDISDVTSTELQGEINKYTNEATVTGSGILKITYTSGREYDINQNGNIVKTESYDGMYSAGDLEGKIAPEDLFEYEIIDEQNKTARILRIKAEYCNIDGFNLTTEQYDVTDTEGNIIYKGEQISDILVIPYEVTINGGKYTITEANISATRREFYSSLKWNYMTFPNVKSIVYPNTIEKMEYYITNESDNMSYYNDTYNRYSILENITFSNNVKAVTYGMLHNTSWYENQPDGDIYIGKLYYGYKGEMPENTSITIKEGTTAIADLAFYDCENLTNITIPDSVTSIGNNAFYGTKWYDDQPDGDLYIGKVYYQYKGDMPENTSITIKEGTTQIGQEAFYYCSNLTSITIPDSVTSIGDYAFYECSNLTNIAIPDGVRYIGMNAFYYCESLTSITIPDSVTSIGMNVFADCSNLTSVIIPNSVTTIGEGAFSYCESLTSVIIPDSVTSIVEGAFYGCSNLTNITIPNSVTSIGGDAFSGTGWLNNQPEGDFYIGTIYYGYLGEIPGAITIREGTTSIVDGAFYNCSSLTSITIPDSITSIGNQVFFGCDNLINVTIPDSVTTIGHSAFEYCDRLTSITIPEGVKIIEGFAFNSCESLTNITIPDSVTYIGQRAFQYCRGLTSITIPASVTRIEYATFEYCGSLRTVNYKGTEEQWNQIPIGSYNSNLTAATINYNYTGE